LIFEAILLNIDETLYRGSNNTKYKSDTSCSIMLVLHVRWVVIMDIAKKALIYFVIEDAAQGIMSKYQDIAAGIYRGYWLY
jgi:hypothetical protein